MHLWLGELDGKLTGMLAEEVGLDIHEWPYLVANDATPLAPGMCFSDEPGLYIPGKFGVRLEDSINAIARFEGLRRRLETVGSAAGVTVTRW